MTHDRTRTLVLASGGIDSSCLIPFLAVDNSPIHALFVDYGQLSSKNEARAVAAIAAHFNVVLRAISVIEATPKPVGLIQGRNAMLISLALAEFAATSGLIAIGVHAGTDYPDCTESFIAAMQRVADVYFRGTVQIIAPFLRWSKRDIWDYARERIPVSSTYSCERGLPQPCGGCLSCMDLESLNART